MENERATTSNQMKSNEEQPDDEEVTDEFFDAECEAVFVCGATQIDLNGAIEEAKEAISLFFNNKFNEARQLLQPSVHCSMYHAMGNAVFAFLEAMLTFEHDSIMRATEETKQCLMLCQRERKKFSIAQSIGSQFRKYNYNEYTDLEAHAELCFAETLLLRAMLTFLEDETLASFIKGGLKIRQCFNCYKECAEILKRRQWESSAARTHFESGVCMGMGAFNLMISLLPAKIIKILEFIGFSGNKTLGLENLDRGYRVEGLRQVLCALCLLGYNLIVCYVLSHEEGDLELSSHILEQQLAIYPKGIWFLFFKGRFEFVQGNFDEAVKWYYRSCNLQSQWKQFNHVNYWELLWVHCLRQDWEEACVFATRLLKESKWSRTMYSYQKAAILLMKKSLSEIEQQTVDELMREAPLYKQRIAGKSLPMEKFVCNKAQRYFKQNNTLCLPVFELMQLWNFFKILKRNPDALCAIHNVIEQQIERQVSSHANEEYKWENHALCMLLRGICYRHMNKEHLALQDLNECIQLEAQLKADTYIIPYAHVEIALLHAEGKRIQLAVTILENTRKKYTGYLLESRLHFRIHAALLELKKH